MAVHQLLPHFRIGDAVSQSAVHFQALLRRLGHWGEIFSVLRDPGTEDLVRTVNALRVRPGDLVLGHQAIGSPVSARLMHLPCKRGVVFHNLSPLRFYAGTPLEAFLRAGRAQLAGLASHVHLGIGVSEFNASEMRAAGYANVHVVPLFVEPERFGLDRVDGAMAARLRTKALSVFSVSRVVPHKRFEDLLALHREVRRLRPEAQLRVVGGVDRLFPAMRQLEREALRTPGVTFLGRVNHGELVAAYRSASLFVSMSEHEGFGVPLLEAMASDVPVLAYAAAAVPETLDGAGIGFTEKRFALLAELVVQLAEDQELRTRVLKGQQRRLERGGADASQERLEAALESIGVRRPPRPRRRGKGKPRVGLVVQRYGQEITGGAEALAAQVAQHLRPHWDITVITTCATDHLSWANVLPPGESMVDGVRVVRFPVRSTRNRFAHNAMSRRLYGRSLDRSEEELWLASQGPLAPGLFRHLAEEGGRYDGFLVFTYLYVTGAWTVPMLGRRALVVPTAHEEPAFRFDVFADVFERPRALLTLTEEERQLIQARFPRHAPARVVGVGVEPPRTEPQRFRSKFGIDRPYLMYVGRVEKGKGIYELLRAHARLRAADPESAELVLVGDSSVNASGQGVRLLGRIGEQDKWDGLAGAEAVVVPSARESLSLLTLEAMAVGTPVIGNIASAVVGGHLERSQGGVAYRSSADFAEVVRTVRGRREALARAGRKYARRYRWSTVVEAYRRGMAVIVEDG
jgi:glycosyltransferase involved in cell wall biosynthesis